MKKIRTLTRSELRKGEKKERNTKERKEALRNRNEERRLRKQQGARDELLEQIKETGASVTVTEAGHYLVIPPEKANGNGE